MHKEEFMKITIDANTEEGKLALQDLADLSTGEEETEAEFEPMFDSAGIMKLAGYGNQMSVVDGVSEEENDETPNQDINKVNDGDSDGRGYEYGDDAYNLFGNAKQKLRYVPAISGDNALQEKSFSNYFLEAQKKNG